jgi:TonB-linked SusC/RagA family outer membrane protein
MVHIVCWATTSFAQLNITGKVTAEDGSGIPGVSVVEKGTTNGTISDDRGVYAFSIHANATLVFSSIGFETQEVVVGDQTTINVLLKTDIKTLSEVVVVGYGSQRKVDVTGAVVQVKGEEISKQSSVNPLSSLQGKVAGVQITNSGAPGSSPQITIRGTGTVYGNANPLYVVDGVWYDDITFLNPADIENISVLKDASSEAIYGVRAANGVILITTKKGSKNQKTVVNYNGFVGNQVVTNEVKLANGPQYATLINELDAANGATPRYSTPNSFGSTDWNHQVFRNALISNHNVSVAGGGEKSTFNFSLGYTGQDGTVKTNNFNRYTARLQNDFQVFDFLKLGYTVTGTVNNSGDIDNSIFHQAYTAAPIVPVYYADGTYGDPNDFHVGNSNSFNPQVTLDYYNQKTKNYRATGNVYAEAKFAKHFTWKTSVGGDFWLNSSTNYAPKYVATLSQRNTTSVLNVNKGETRNWLLENTLVYDNQFGDHGVKVLLGQSVQNYQYYGLTARAQNVPNGSDGDHYLSLGDLATRYVSDNGSFSRIQSYFGRLNYSFKEKYLLNVSMRADGSSKFSGSDQWGYFPSVGAGWVISEESFMKNQNIFDNLKLRASWGKIGNVSVPSNLSIPVATQSDGYSRIGGNGAVFPGANIDRIFPPTTVWERGIGTDIGLESTVLNNKLFFEFDFYNKKTEKAIFSIPLLGSLGTNGSTIVGNQATFQNQGFEFLVRWKDQINSEITYSISANMGINENKVLETLTGANPIYQAVGTTGSNNFNTRTVLGQPIGQFYGLKVIGVFQNAADITNYKSSSGQVLQAAAAPGDFKYADTNGDGVIDDRDRVVLGNPNPKVIYGINTNVGYKSFDLTVDFQGVSGVQIYNANLGLRYGTENFTKDFFDKRWHGDGTSNSYPSANIGGGTNYRSNSFFVESGSYFRVRNIQLGYTLPSSLVNKWKLTKLRVYANAQNALNFFKYRGFTPEVGGGPTTAGVDVNVYPLYATYNFGVNVTF